MTRRQKPQATALDAFLATKIEIDAFLAPLQSLSDDHFGADPELIDLAHVGDLGRMKTQLQDIADRAFREGEYAALRGRRQTIPPAFLRARRRRRHCISQANRRRSKAIEPTEGRSSATTTPETFFADGITRAAEPTTPSPRDGTKQVTLIAMLRADTGANFPEIMEATGW